MADGTAWSQEDCTPGIVDNLRSLKPLPERNKRLLEIIQSRSFLQTQRGGVSTVVSQRVVK